MSKYDLLWEFVKNKNEPVLTLSFDEIKKIARVPIDHSFLQYKKELLQYGFSVGKISMKNRTVGFIKNGSEQL